MKQSKVSKAIQQYFKNTTLHGFKYLSSVHYVDRVVWVVWCCASAWCAGSLCVVLWRRYLQVPALLVLCDDDARTLSYSRYGVPTVAACLPPDVVADMFLHRLSSNSTLTEQIPSSLARVLAGKPTLTDQLELFDDLLASNNTTLAHMMMNHAPNCDEEAIIKCRYQKRMVPCQQLFEKTLTYWGVCCVMRPEKLLPKFNTGLVSRSHTMQSLELVLQCKRGPFPSVCQFLTYYKGEEWVQPNILHPSNYYMGHLVFTLIPDESTSLVETVCSHDPNYSRTHCMRKCAEKSCGCRDPLFKHVKSDSELPVCSTARLICLRSHDLKQHENISCSCLPPCRKITTTMVLESNPMNQINNTIDNLFSGIDVARSVVMNLRVNLHHSQVFLLNPTETWVTLLSSLGGVFNMFLGVGLFSALELIYFLMIKLPVAIRKSSEVDHTNKYTTPVTLR
ncbi:sodium channel protein Nach-like isoform X2 [Spodoptera litura]|uniref:Sodium channel protein Nach-like isoform X2 n=1 Tax=Spodoptera litura TaxID=69820 RepID=A0A9J7EJ27_SPOLT|nr:sodium channel protein Nach-like isoform X2 [Spodoptera litura]